MLVARIDDGRMKKRERSFGVLFSFSPLSSCMYIRDEKSPDGAALFPRQAPAVSATTARTIGPDELPNGKISFSSSFLNEIEFIHHLLLYINYTDFSIYYDTIQ